MSTTVFTSDNGTHTLGENLNKREIAKEMQRKNSFLMKSDQRESFVNGEPSGKRIDYFVITGTYVTRALLRLIGPVNCGDCSFRLPRSRKESVAWITSSKKWYSLIYNF